MLSKLNGLILLSDLAFFKCVLRGDVVSASPSVALEQLSPPKKPEAPHVVVYVSEAVTNPGIYKVPSASRVVDVIEVAGGLAAGADVNKVNMAKPVEDGMQVNVLLVPCS